MKFKKSCSLLIVLAMVISILGSLGITAFAGNGSITKTIVVGEKTTISIPVQGSFAISDEAAEGNIKNVFAESNYDVLISNIRKDGSNLLVDVIGLKSSKNISIKRTAYDENEKDWIDYPYATINVINGHDFIEITEMTADIKADIISNKDEYLVGIEDDIITKKLGDTSCYAVLSKIKSDSLMFVVYKDGDNIGEGEVDGENYASISDLISAINKVVGNEADVKKLYNVKELSEAKFVDFLDLDSEDASYKDSKEIEQKYDLLVKEGDKTDVTKVKVSWSIKNIEVTRKESKVWDTESLTWVDGEDSKTTIDTKGSAEFKFENYSSTMLDAIVSFKADGEKSATVAFDESTGTDGRITIDTVNGSKTYTKENIPSGTITVTVTPSEDDFKDASTAKNEKYGTYTVCIAKSIAETFALTGFYDGEQGNAKINGMNSTELCQYMVERKMINDASEFGDVLVKTTYYSRMAKQFINDERKLSLLFGTEHQDEVAPDLMKGDNDHIMDIIFNTYFNGTFTWEGSYFNFKSQQK